MSTDNKSDGSIVEGLFALAALGFLLFVIASAFMLIFKAFAWIWS